MVWLHEIGGTGKVSSGSSPDSKSRDDPSLVCSGYTIDDCGVPLGPENGGWTDIILLGEGGGYVTIISSGSTLSESEMGHDYSGGRKDTIVTFYTPLFIVP